MKAKLRFFLVCTTLIIISFVITACGTSTVDLNKYISFNEEGYDGNGTITVAFDTDTFIQDYQGKIKLSKEYQQGYETFEDFGFELSQSDIAGMLYEECIAYQIDFDSQLSNGDIVTLQWNNDIENALQNYNVKFKCSPLTYKVHCLQKAEQNSEQLPETEKASISLEEDKYGEVIKSGNYRDFFWVLYEDEHLVLYNDEYCNNGENWEKYRSYISSVIVKDGVAKIYGFDGYADLTGKDTRYKHLEEVDLPDGLAEVGGFQNCINLTQIDIPNTVTVIASHAFDGCEQLRDITLPQSLEEIGEAAFMNCSTLETIIIPENVYDIPLGAFANCRNLQSIQLPTHLESIGANAFYGNAISTISIPSTVQYIGSDAFSYCTSLKDINYNGTTAQWKAIWPSQYLGIRCSGTVHCSNGDIVYGE